MKNKLILACVTAATLATPASAETWVVASMSKDGIIIVDADSVYTYSRYKRVHTVTVLPRVQKIIPGVLYIEATDEVDCENETIRSRNYLAYDPSGNLAWSDVAPGKWSPIGSGTANDVSRDIACSDTFDPSRVMGTKNETLFDTALRLRGTLDRNF